MTLALEQLDPVPTLLARIRGELAGVDGDADVVEAGLFDLRRGMRISRAPGRLDVMGGIADYTGSLVCEQTLDRAAAVGLQERVDRQVQIFSFNLLDEHRPFTFRMPLDALAAASTEALNRELAEPGRRWAGYLIGCLHLLQREGLVDWGDSALRGMNLALFSTVPSGAGVSSSAAIEVATMMNLVDHLDLRGKLGEKPELRVAGMCQAAENLVVGAPCGIMDQATSCAGHAGQLLRMVCQPHDLLPPLAVPEGMRFVGINSSVTHSVGGSAYGRTRCAAFMAHAMILEKMRDLGNAAGRELIGDPMGGYLANLDAEDYKRFFRSFLPEQMGGRAFLERYGRTIDRVTRVEAREIYPVQHAADHHVLEARRVRNFARFLEEAAPLPPGKRERGLLLDKAGHLMYASHLSYGHDAMLGAAECDLLVDALRKREKKGIYGARITGGGSGGTVAVLCEKGDGVDAALGEVMAEYEKETGHRAEAFGGTSAGAWDVGTSFVGW